MAYSPVWTYSFLNAGKNTGAFITDAYDFLRKHGALRVADCDYEAPLYERSTNTDKMIEALNIRIVNDGSINISTNNASKNLDDIKDMLYGTDGTDGRILAVSVPTGWVSGDYENNKNIDSVIYCLYYTSSGHSMVIVGYDDNIWVDINGNKEQDDGELGTFKLANSWGTSKNNGFVWISYDALNAKTLVDGDWEEKLYNRPVRKL